MSSRWILAGLLAIALPMRAFAGESEGASRFRLLSMKCEADEGGGAEVTPQSPPLNVDDPSTPGCNRWEINVVADGDFARSQSTMELPLLDINYGIGDNLQLKFELPYTVASGGIRDSALGESKLGIKHEFFEEEGSGLEIAFYPQVSFVDASAPSVQKGLTSPGSIVTLPLLLSKTIGRTGLGDVKMTANLSYNLSSKEDEASFFGGALALGTAIHPKIALMGELVTEQATASDAEGSRRSLVAANLGVMGTLSSRFLLFGSIGHSLYSSDQEGHAYALTGARLLFSGI